jgi:hypothetical protein
MIKRAWWLAAGWLVLMGCAASPDRHTEDAVRNILAARLAETQQSQAAALALWDRIIFGETVSCQEVIQVPLPLALPAHDLSAYPQVALIQARLNEAIQEVRNSSDLWNIECSDSRTQVPLSTAKEGRAEALSASEPLAEAAALLAAWSG